MLSAMCYNTKKETILTSKLSNLLSNYCEVWEYGKYKESVYPERAAGSWDIDRGGVIGTAGVSLVTIRKDVRALAAQNLIVRQHGKISLPIATQQSYLPFHIRSISQIDDKKCIAQVAASMIDVDDTIILDAGTTTLAIAMEIGGGRR